MCQVGEVSLSWMCCHVDLGIFPVPVWGAVAGSSHCYPHRWSPAELHTLYPLHCLSPPWAHPIPHPCPSYLLALPGPREGGEPSLSLGLLQYLLHSRAPRNGSMEPFDQQTPTSLCRLAWSHHTMPFQPVSEHQCGRPACFSLQPSLPGSLSTESEAGL